MTQSKPTRNRPKPSVPRISAFEKAANELRQPTRDFPLVSPRWLLSAAAIAVLAAVALGWIALCFLYWQGSWQLLYHPKTEMTRTPASIGLPFESIKFAATETGTTQLTGWWLPAENARFTVLYLHGADGNLSETVDSIASLHRQHLNVFAFDYRGYGQSQTIREAGKPSEQQLRQDSEWALTWLTLTRSFPAKSVVLFGSGLGATIAAELAADHPELTGVILDAPQQNATTTIFNDSRSRLVPAQLLVKDRYNLTEAVQALRIPSLWLLNQPATGQTAIPPAAYKATQVNRTLAWLNAPSTQDPHFSESVQRWIDDLPVTARLEH